jgi:hypothetical protein
MAPRYSENAGGAIVAHKLCDLLNINHVIAQIFPYSGFEFDNLYASNTPLKDRIRLLPKRPENIKFFLKYYWDYYKSANINWSTPIINPIQWIAINHLYNYIIVYPETVYGNPLGGKNVVRYFLHNPGYWTGKVDYGEGELYFRYSNSFARDFIPMKGSVVSPHLITIYTTPSCYNLEGASKERKGTAYLVRKGAYKPIIHDLSDSIKIDGKSHKEIAEIFKQVDTFISYDAATAYNRFALLCGCKSVIILGEDETPSTYNPDAETRSHFAYSLDTSNINWKKARIWAEEQKAIEEKISQQAVIDFINDCQDFFDNKGKK